MRYEFNELKIILENESKISAFWNIIAFAFDLQAIRKKENKPCMTESELELANKLYELTQKRY